MPASNLISRYLVVDSQRSFCRQGGQGSALRPASGEEDAVKDWSIGIASWFRRVDASLGLLVVHCVG